MKQFITLLFASIVLLIANTQINACGLDPTAVIDVYPGNDVVFYDGDYIYLEAYASTANCGYITVIEWQIDGVVVSNGWGFEPDFSLDQGEYNRRFDVQLTVGNSGANFDTINITIAIVSEFKSYYYLKDHLGSVRVTVNDAGAPVGWDDYYPFGLQMPGRTQNNSNPNDDAKFTGYLLEKDGDLGLYHAEARMYDPVIGRFMQVDPLSKQFPDWNPYHYTHNNPLNMIDPTGMASCDSDRQNKDCSFLGRLKEMVGISVMDHELPLEASAVVGLNEIMKVNVIEGIDKAIPVLETVGDGAEVAELGLGVMAIPSGGATGPASGVAGVVGTGSDLLTGGLMLYRHNLTGENSSDGEFKLAEAGLGLFASKMVKDVSSAAVKKTSQAVKGPDFRSGFTGRFISNYQGNALKHTAPAGAGAAAALTVSIFQTIFE